MTSLSEKVKGLSRQKRVGRFCALDFDSRQIRIVEAESSGGRTRIRKAAAADMPEGIALADAGAVGEFVGRTLAEMHLSGAAVLMNVPRSKAVLKPLVLPPVSGPAELANMVRFQAEKELTFRPEEAVVDFTIESHYGAEPGPEDEPQGEHVLVAAVQQPVLEYYRQIAEAAGVRLLRLGLRPYANMRCVEAYVGSLDRGRVALVHMAADETEIDVMEEDGLTFSRSAVIEIPPPSRHDEPTSGEAVATIVQEVARSLQSYMGVERGQGIEAVVLAGGTGIETQVAESLASRLNVPCEVLDLASALQMREVTAGASAFISALGLALEQGDAAAPPFDFLNPKRAPVERDLTKIFTIAAVAAVVLVVVAAFAGAGLHWYNAALQVSQLTAELKQLKAENKKVTALRERVETIEKWVKGGRNWLDQWAYLTGVFPSCSEAYVTSLSTNPDASLKFNVRARNNDAINSLGDRLAQAGYDFKPGQVTTSSDRYGYDYSTALKVMVDADMEVALADLSPPPRPDDDVSAERFGRPPESRSSGGPPSERPGEARPSSPRPPPENLGEPKPSTAGPLSYQEWDRQRNELYRQRPSKEAGEEARREWYERYKKLMERRPSSQSRPPGETRYPNGRDHGRPPSR